MGKNPPPPNPGFPWQLEIPKPTNFLLCSSVGWLFLLGVWEPRVPLWPGVSRSPQLGGERRGEGARQLPEEVDAGRGGENKKKEPNKEPRSGLLVGFPVGARSGTLCTGTGPAHTSPPRLLSPLATAPALATAPRHAFASLPGQASPNSEDAAPPETPSAIFSPRSTQGELSFAAHTLRTTRCRPGARHLSCQNLRAALLDARSCFLRPAPAAACPKGERRARKVWLWHRPARPAARQDLPPRPTQPKLTWQSCPGARRMQGHPSCACHPLPHPGTRCEGHPPQVVSQ